MKLQFSINALALGASLFGVLGAAAPYPTGQFCVPHTVTSWEQSEIFKSFVDTMYVQKNIADAFHTTIVSDYTQHNPFVLSGAQNAVNYLSPFWNSVDIEIYHLTSVDQNLGWIHFRIQGGPIPVETAIVDIYRFNGSCIVEHWDVIESKPANATNPLALF